MSIIGRGLVRSEPGRAQPGSEGCFDAARPRAFPGGRARGGEAAPLNHAPTSPAPVPAEPALRVQFCFRLQGEANNSSQVWVCIAFGPCTQPAFQPRKPSRGACPGSECSQAEELRFGRRLAQLRAQLRSPWVSLALTALRSTPGRGRARFLSVENNRVGILADAPASHGAGSLCLSEGRAHLGGVEPSPRGRSPPPRPQLLPAHPTTREQTHASIPPSLSCLLPAALLRALLSKQSLSFMGILLGSER